MSKFTGDRQFIDSYKQQGYPEEIKKECLEMYVNGLGFRAIERVKKVHHTTVINWVRELGNTLPNSGDRMIHTWIQQRYKLNTVSVERVC